MTLSLAEIESLCYNWLITRPYHYAVNFPSWAESKLPSMKRLIAGEYFEEGQSNITSLVTEGGNNFTLFAKSSIWGKDIYHDLIAPEYKNKIYALSWSLGTGTFPSDCSAPYEAHNILLVSYDGIIWKRTQNHAKLAVVGSAACFGDVNRQSGQLKRGGAMYCSNNAAFAKEMTATVVDVEACS
jgi:deoxyribonuclease-2